MSERELTEEQKEQARKHYEEKIEEVDQSHFEKVIKRSKAIMGKFEKVPVLGRYLPYAPVMIDLVRDYMRGVYREIPYFSIAAIVAALIYVLSPIDLIPDFIPFIGYLDDAAVIAFCLELVKKDLDAYIRWQEGQENQEIIEE